MTENIEDLQQKMVEAQRELYQIQSDFNELLNGYQGFDDIIVALEDMRRANDNIPPFLIEKLNEIIEAVERRKT